MLAACLCFATLPAGAEDYSTIQGDFGVFRLRDSPGVIMDKIAFLKKKRMTRGEPVARDRTISIALAMDGASVECHLDFTSGKLYSIRTYYNPPRDRNEYSTKLADEMARKASSLRARYGAPTEVFPAPTFEEIRDNSLKTRVIGTVVPLWIWEPEGKTVVLGMHADHRVATVHMDSVLNAENTRDMEDAKRIPYEYKFLLRDDSGLRAFRVDEPSIKYVEDHSSAKVIDCWIRIDYTQEGRRSLVETLKARGHSPPICEKVKFTLHHYQISGNRYRTTAHSYNSFEDELWTERTDASGWTEAAARTTGALIIDTLSRYAEKYLKK